MIAPITPRIRNNNGFSLIEAAIVLGVVGLVIGGIWVAATSVSENRRQTRAIGDILQITSNVRKLYGAHPPAGYTNLNAATALLSSIFPSDTLINNTPTTPWGDPWDVSTNGGSILLSTIPMNVSTCATLAPKISTAIYKQSGTVSTFYHGRPLDTPALAAANCQTEYDDEGDVGISIIIPY